MSSTFFLRIEEGGAVRATCGPLLFSIFYNHAFRLVFIQRVCERLSTRILYMGGGMRVERGVRLGVERS